MVEKYTIDIYRLREGSYEYEFEINEVFFSKFIDGLLERGNVNVHVELMKSSRFIEVKFNFRGTVELICDRSLDKFDYPLNLEGKLLFKFGEEESELSDDVMMITKNTQQINLAQHIYEFISLSVPVKKLHPKFADDDEFEDEIIYSTDADDESESNEENEEIDPRWDKLLKFKMKNNN